MPEIKNTFAQGKMNKDLDERLIPNGQYRHALNVSVDISDGSDVGAIENIKGNTRIDSFLQGSSSEDTPLIIGPYTCVGSIVDEANDVFYWFISSPNIDAIAQYNEATGVSSFVAVDIAQQSTDPDVERFLNFTGKPITGINIIDNFIFWTDGDTEPKRLNIDHLEKLTNTDQHSRLYVDGEDKGFIKEEHVTVIRKKPSIAPSFKINTSENTGRKPIFEKIFPRFSFRYKYRDGEYSAFAPFTDVVFNPEYVGTNNEFNTYTIDEPYNKAMVNSISSIELYNFVPSDIPADVVQVDLLYKQENSPIVYSLANIKYTDPEWQMDGYTGNISGTTTAHKGYYSVTTENVRAAVPENQILRPYDNVPRTAVAQEIVANRLVYGNYKQGYDIEGSLAVNCGVELRQDQDFTNGGQRSIKSLRDYQVGVVFGDEYGRETPVFTSGSANTQVNWSGEFGLNASSSLMLNANVDLDTPYWAKYYKFYVKETSGEYYNLVMDNAYIPQAHNDFNGADKFAWLSFPSAERNKLMEEDFIIVKKIISQDPQQITYNNRYKIIDIADNAPEAVKYNFINIGEFNNSDTNVLTTAGIFPTAAEDLDKRIDVRTDVILVNRTPFEEGGGSSDLEIKQGIYLSWRKGNLYSDRYKVSDVSETGDVYTFRLSKKIKQVDADIAEGLFVEGLAANLVVAFERRVEKEGEDFSGKFFVKVKRDASIAVANESDLDDVFVTQSQSLAYLYGSVTTTNDETLGIVNSTNQGQLEPTDYPSNTYTSVDFANTRAEWNDITEGVGGEAMGRKFFIDSMPFIASNPSITHYAKESGEGWRGSLTQYESFSWGPRFPQMVIAGGVVQGASPSDPGFDGAPFAYTWNFGEAAPINWDGTITNLSVEEHYMTPGGYGLAPRPILNSTESLIVQESIINGLEGIVVSNDSHITHRRWKTNTIFSSTNFDNSYGQPSSNIALDEAPDVGRYFMHISFLAPGENLTTDLPGNENLEGIELTGPNSAATILEGIYGGGIFTKTPDSISLGDGELAPPTTFDNNDEFFVEFEGNYAQNGEGLPGSPGFGTQGYNPDYELKHALQWDPSFNGSQFDGAIQEFIDKIQDTTSKFRFAEDDSETIYSILSCSRKKIYNHTSWRKRWLWDGTAYTTAPQNDDGSYASVEQAAVAWANAYGGDQDAQDEAAQDLRKTLRNFGEANNRRTCYIVEVDKNPNSFYNPTLSSNSIDLNTLDSIEFISDQPPIISSDLLVNPAVWETEPRQLPELNIYYEASSNIPTEITKESREIFAPAGCKVEVIDVPESVAIEDSIYVNENFISTWLEDETAFKLTYGLPRLDITGENANYNNALLKFTRPDGSYVINRIFEYPGSSDDLTSSVVTEFMMSTVVDMRENAGLSWFNCYTFGDGLESDRIRDSFNEMQLSNGAKASATLEEPFAEEVRKYGLIYSGIYNSNSGVNNLNQFIAAEKITKDLNPTYGSVQKLFTRDTDLITLCEDKVLKILANKDALFNADGNPQLVSNSKVLGQSIPFVGDYGISKNPESFAADNFRAYFADKQRRSVLRLSRDGLTPISDYGMRDWFIDHLDTNINILGSYDDFSDQYNITLSPQQQPNLILNNTLQEGTLSEIFSTFGDVVLNGSFGSGAAFNADISLLEQSQNQLLTNSDFDMSSTVTYHPLIPVGDIIEESGGDPIPLTVTGDSFVVGAPGITDASINSNGAGAAGTILVYQTLFRSYGQDLSTAQTSGPLFGFRLQDHYGVGASPRYQGRIEFDPAGQPYNPWGGNIFPYFTYIPDIANIDDDNQFYILERNYYYPSFPDYGTDSGLVVSKLASPDAKYYIWPNHQYNPEAFTTTTSVYPAIDNNVPSGIFNDPDYQDIGIKNSTIFYGEEVLISFRAAHPYGQSNASSETNPFAKFKIKIYDGFTEIPDNLLYGPVDTPGNDYLSRHMEEGFPPGNFHHLGYRTVNENTFGNPVTDMRQFSILYKFTNPEDREASGIAVNDLKVRLELSYGNTNGQPVTIESFRIEKVFHLNERTIEGGGTTPYIAPVPDVEIPAWFEVAHTPFEGWTSNSISTLEYSGFKLLGSNNPGTPVQYGEGENDFYLTGTTNSEIPNSILAEVAQNYFQNGGATIYNFNGPDATARISTTVTPDDTPIALSLSTSASIQQGRTYILDLGYDLEQLTSSTINASPTDFIGLKLSDINGGVDFELSSRDYTTPSTILRAQFTADADYENITIAPDVLEHPYEVIIQNASLIDITSSSSGGTASNWNIPLSAYFTDTILESPEVYYDGSKIIFNTTQIEDRSVTQSLSNNLTLTSSADGWNFTFDAEVTQGSLSGYVSNGENLGFEFSGLEESGTYVINGNFNTGYAVTATKDGETYPLTVSTISAASNTDPLSIVFQPETEVFVGSLDNVKLENQTQYLGSVSSANDFVISDTFNPAINNYITWEDEKINFNYAPDNAFIYQNIGVLQEGDTYKITLEGVAFNEGTDDKIRVYYRSENNLGFEFTFTANGFEERQKTISFSEVEFEFPDNALVIAPASGTVFNGTVDNIVVQRYLDDEPEYTISYSEKANGWVSFKSFIPESALSLSGSYYTFKEGKPYKHNSNEYRGVFYHDGGNVIPTNEASVTFILNEAASSVKSFKTLNYEGTEGWENEYVTTDMESGYVSHFIEKEGKWFNYVHGGAKGFTQPVLNTSDFNFQGLGTTVTE